jgi:hypothetical protein
MEDREIMPDPKAENTITANKKTPGFSGPGVGIEW